MEPTIGSGASTYLWLQGNAWRYDFVLHHQGQDIGTLKATSWAHQEFEGSTKEGVWFFRQEGFWRREIVCEEAPARQRVASFKPNWSISEGKIELADGRTFHWSTTGFLHPVSQIVDYKGRKVLDIKEGNSLKLKGLKDLFRSGATIVRGESPCDTKTFSLLCVFTWYLLLCRRDETSSAATVAAIS
jgi:hypothetical protein